MKTIQVDASYLPNADANVRLMWRMGLMFFASGAAALAYQVLFAKELALVFGSTATATLTVLATFLGGMSIGSLIGGALAWRVKRAILVYAVAELAIAGFCLLTPILFAAIRSTYVFLAADLAPASPTLLLLRVALGAGVLLIPTILMGITLPLLAQALNPNGDQLGKAVGWLYTCNTAGAALGALATSYAVIPFFGVHATTMIAASMNVLVAWGAWHIARISDIASIGPLAIGKNVFETPTLRMPELGGWRVLFSAWLALGVGGLLSLGLEVVYVHMLSIVAGNSVYAFGLMLATFLIGLTLGGALGRLLLGREGVDRAAWLAGSQLGLAVTVALGAMSWDLIPAYFAGFAGSQFVNSFATMEAVRAAVCALVMVPPTVCIGCSYTLGMDLATTATARRGITMLGIGAALNTLGNIAGVLLFGFLLLPRIGGLAASNVIVISALLMSLLISVLACKRKVWRWMGVASASVVALLVLSPARLDYDLLSSGANVYFKPQNWGKVIAHAESIDGGLTAVSRYTNANDVITTLVTNGKFQGNDARNGELQAQIGFAALPLLHQERRDNALIIGYGTGTTARVLHDAGFQHIDIAELSGDVVTLSDDYFHGINGFVSTQSGVQTHITDGRNFLLLTKRQYDVIGIEITSIWFAGAAALYNREFYQLARAKLRSDGVLQQWVQLHHMASADLLTIICTLRSEFRYVSLYVVGNQGILIATDDKTRSEPSAAAIAALDASPLLPAVRAMAGRSFADIADDLILSPPEIDSLLTRLGPDREAWISTDNNLKLEYSTPKANANPADQSMEKNLELIRSAQTDPAN
jgi:spermidine synthase